MFVLRRRYWNMLPLLAPLLGVAASDVRGGAAEVVGSEPPASPARPAEVRAVWVTRWDCRSQRDLRAMVSNCASVGINRVYFQVRGQADALYRSSLEPWSEVLGGEPGFDPLATALAACRDAGIELFAWVNVLPGWKGAEAPRSPDHLVHRRPEWFVQDREGRRVLLDADRYAILNPCLPEVRAHLAAVVDEIAAGYEVDGIQLDYIRFLSRDLARGEDVPYDAATLARFRRRTGGFPARFPIEWDRFRMEAMDALVRELAAAVRRHRPRASISVAAVKDIGRARSHLFQDAVRWHREGWIDEVCPMLYVAGRPAFETLVRSFLDELPAAAVVPGIGAYTVSAADVGGQIDAARRARTPGYALFAYTSLFLSRSPHSSHDARAAELRARMRKVVTDANVVETAGAAEPVPSR